jgi:hypothetical protein
MPTKAPIPIEGFDMVESAENKNFSNPKPSLHQGSSIDLIKTTKD